MLKVNVTGTFNMLESLRKTDCKQFIYTSTSEIYGNNASPFHEGLLPMPVSPYSLTKEMAEQLIKTFCNQYNRNYTILRLFNFFGKNMSEDFFISEMINNLKRGEDFLMTKGEQKRDFLFVEDVIRALILATEKPEAYNETLNVCSGVGSPLASLARMINSKIQGTAKVKIGALPYRNNEVWEMIGTTTKCKETLGFIPHYSLEDGLDKILTMKS
jgi:UDP-glucose 4-epimerase